MPEDVSWNVNATPTRAAGAVLALVITGAAGAGLTTKVRSTDVVPPALVAESVTTNEPVSVGVPLITPVAASKVEFLGAEGAVLATVEAAAGEEVHYSLRGGEGYVRARVTGKDGKRAWTQAYRLAR